LILWSENNKFVNFLVQKSELSGFHDFPVTNATAALDKKKLCNERKYTYTYKQDPMLSG
jgi:hypothetical protein